MKIEFLMILAIVALLSSACAIYLAGLLRACLRRQ